MKIKGEKLREEEKKLLEKEKIPSTQETNTPIDGEKSPIDGTKTPNTGLITPYEGRINEAAGEIYAAPGTKKKMPDYLGAFTAASCYPSSFMCAAHVGRLPDHGQQHEVAPWLVHLDGVVLAPSSGEF